jgi:hypothetical protein
VPLVNPKVPAAIESAFKKGLEEMVHMDRAPAGLAGWMVQRVCVLTHRDAARGKDLSASRPGPWRFVTGDHRGPAAALTIPPPARGQRPKMTSMETGSGIRQSFREVDAIERMPAVRRRNYELRRLKLPGIIGAFWLVALDDPDLDLIVPYASVVRGLTGMKPYSVETFLARVRPIAEKRLAEAKFFSVKRPVSPEKIPRHRGRVMMA